MMRLKNLALGLLVCLGAMNCRSSFADTLTFQSSTGSVVDGVYVYPYNMSVNGSAQTTPMMCINYNDHITTGETWQVTSQQLSTSSSVQLKEDAWLFSQVGKSNFSYSDIQFAVWDVLYPGVDGNSGLNLTAKTLVLLAELNQGSLTNAFLNQYMIYIPDTTATQPWTDGLPQTFITTDPAAVTPEPSSLLLLGTGLCAVGALWMRRRRDALEGLIG